MLTTLIIVFVVVASIAGDLIGCRWPALRSLI